jgi:hypothetical protein
MKRTIAALATGICLSLITVVSVFAWGSRIEAGPRRLRQGLPEASTSGTRAMMACICGPPTRGIFLTTTPARSRPTGQSLVLPRSNSMAATRQRSTVPDKH